MKKFLLGALAVVSVVALAITGTIAYLQWEDSAVNVMTLGNVKIEQHVYERVVENGGWVSLGEVDKYGYTPDKLKTFDQMKPLYPAVFADGVIKWDDRNGSQNASGDGSHQQSWGQVGAPGSNQLFDGSVKNAQDHFVFVENTGKSDAYVRTMIALEQGAIAAEDFDKVIMANSDKSHWAWEVVATDVVIDGSTYYVLCATYVGPASNPTGVLAPGATTYASLLQVYMRPEATNADVAAIDGNNNGLYDILVLSQAVQTEGFTDAKTALDAAFGAGQPFGDDFKVEVSGWVYDEASFREALNQGEEEITLGGSFSLSENCVIPDGVIINGNGHTISRADGNPLMRSVPYTGSMMTVKAGSTVTLTDVVLDGGAVWTGEVNPTLGRGTVNEGITATGALITTEGNGNLILGEGVVLRNNGGANAISIATRGGGSLTLNGAQIINNTSAAGAIWGGDDVTINDGTIIRGNHATSIGGAFRMVNGYNAITFTMNGGQIINNYSDGTGGAIWGGNNAKYYFNGGEMAYNYAAGSGGAIWTGTYESYTIAGDFKLHDNACGENIGGAIRFCNYSSLTMTGGAVYNNKAAGQSNAFYLNNNSASFAGGVIADDFSYSGGLGFTGGMAQINGVVAFGLGTNHNTVYLAENFATLRFTTDVSASNFSKFNFKPATGYTYTEGDEAKLICLNEGYETYWDAATSTFKLQAK